jgi:hypothetical protein
LVVQGQEALDLDTFLVDGRCCLNPLWTGYNDKPGLQPFTLYCAACEKFMWAVDWVVAVGGEKGCDGSIVHTLTRLDAHPDGVVSPCHWFGFNRKRSARDLEFVGDGAVRIPPRALVAALLSPDYETMTFSTQWGDFDTWSRDHMVPNIGAKLWKKRWAERQDDCRPDKYFNVRECVLGWAQLPRKILNREENRAIMDIFHQS